MSALVVDASVALKWLVREEGSEAAVALLDDDNQDLCAPDWLLVECTNILWKCVRSGDLTVAEAQDRLRVLAELDPLLRPSRSLVVRALDLSATLNHSSYDMIYVALAEAVGGVVITADAKLVQKLANTRWASMVRLLR